MPKKSIIAILSAVVLTVVASLALVFTMGPKTSAANETIYDMPTNYLQLSGGGSNYLDGLTDEGKNWIKSHSKYRVDIPVRVKTISSRAFANLTGLTSVKIPENVAEIGENAFYGCTGLEEIFVAYGNETFTSRDPYDEYRECNCIIQISNLNKCLIQGCKNTTIPFGVVSIASWAFYNCGLTSVTIPASVVAIGSCAFHSCHMLGEVNFAEGSHLTTINQQAFQECWNLTSIEIPASVTKLGQSLFSGCWRLENVTLPDGITEIGYNLFNGCDSLTSISIPSGVTIIGGKAFADCYSLRDIIIPEGVTEIGTEAFIGCRSASIVIPNSVTTIGCDICGRLDEYNPCPCREIIVCNPDLMYDDNLLQYSGILLYQYNEQNTVHFDSKGGSVVSDKVVDFGKFVEEPVIAKNGYTLRGWYFERYNQFYDYQYDPNIQYFGPDFPYDAYYPRGEQFIKETFNFDMPIRHSYNLHADWEINHYTVKFISQGKTIDVETVDYNTTVSRPEDLTRTGYTLKNWLLDGVVYDFNTPVTDNMTLTANWEINQYTVTFDGNGGSTVDAEIVDYNMAVSCPENPTRTGYTFTKWLLNGSEYDFNTPVIDDITLTADWQINHYTVTFDSNQGSAVASQTVDYNTTITRPENPTRAYYNFKNWLLNGSIFDFDTPITDNITLIADWQIYTYTVTFNRNGGSEVDSQTVDYNTTASQPANPTRTGYTFKKWLLNGSEYNFNTPVTKDVVLTAEWEINQYTVTFNSNGGSDVDEEIVDYNTKVSRPESPTRTGYTFKRWLLNGVVYNFNTPVTDNITLTAEWQINTYTVTFYSNNGTAVNPQTVDYGALATSPETTRTGYTLKGWLLNGVVYYDFDTPVTSNIILIADWEINTYTITFDAQNGDALVEQSVIYNQKVVKPSNPTRAGYIFQGWYTAANEAYNFDTLVSDDLTLHAQWEEIPPHTVTFEVNGTITSQTVRHGETIVVPDKPTQTGYTFIGWYTSDDQYFNVETPITSDVDLHAVWGLNRFVVNFITNHGSTVSAQTVDANTRVNRPVNPTREGYTFIDWYSDEALENKYDFDNLVTGTLALYAKWELNTYTVTFDKQDGSAVSTQEVNHGDVVAEPSASRVGYIFQGWFLNGEPYNFNTPVTGGLTLTAEWEMIKYVVDFYFQGGSRVESQIVGYGTIVDEPVSTKEGYTLMGWFVDDEYNNKFDFSTPITDNIGLWAKWEIKKFTVRFDSTQGSMVLPQTINWNTRVSRPGNPIREGYIFKGWYLNNEEYDFTSAVTADMTLIAKWEAVQAQPEEPETTEPETPDEGDSKEIKNQNNAGLIAGIAGTSAGILVIGGLVAGIVIAKRRRK